MAAICFRGTNVFFEADNIEGNVWLVRVPSLVANIGIFRAFPRAGDATTTAGGAGGSSSLVVGGSWRSCLELMFGVGLLCFIIE